MRIGPSPARRPVSASVGVLCVALLATGCDFDGAYDLPLPGGPVDSDHAFEITAEFDDVLNLVPRSPVKVNDVTVGEVTDVWRVGWHAGVSIALQDDVEIPDNVEASVRQTSLLGEKYVALVPPAGEPHGQLEEGDHLPLQLTGRNPEVEEVLGALSFLLNGGGVGQLKTISNELNLVMEGREERIGHLLGQLDSFVGTLDRQKASIITAMESIRDLSATLNAERETIVDAIDTMGPALAVLADQQDQLMTMLRELDRLGRVGGRVIERTSDDMLAALRHLQPILTKLNEAGQSLPRSLELLVSFPFPKEARKVVKGDYANTEILMDLSLTNLMRQLQKEGGGGGGGPLPDLEVPGLPGPGNQPPLPDLPLPGLGGGDGSGPLGGTVGSGGGLLGGGLG